VTGFDDSCRGFRRSGPPPPSAGRPGRDRGGAALDRGDLRSVADELALVLNLRKGHATARIHTSCELVHNFPATLHALTEGDLTERAAFTIVGELSVLDDLDDLRSAEAAVWPGPAPTRWPTSSRPANARPRPGHRPRPTRPTSVPAATARSGCISTAPAPPTWSTTTKTPPDAAAIMTSLSRAAAYRRRQGDPRTLDQLRADIATHRLLPAPTDQTPTPPTRARHTAPSRTTPADPAPANPAPADPAPADQRLLTPRPLTRLAPPASPATWPTAIRSRARRRQRPLRRRPGTPCRRTSRRP